MLKVDEQRFRKASDYFVTRLAFMDYLEKWNLLDKHILTSSGVSICCPFHYDLEPSLKIDTQRNLFNCFACGESGRGNIITFISKYTTENLGNKTNYYKVLDSLIKSNPVYIADLGFDTIFVDAKPSLDALKQKGFNRVNLKDKTKVINKDLSSLYRLLKSKGSKDDIITAISLIQDGFPIELIYDRMSGISSEVKPSNIFSDKLIKDLLEEGDDD